MLQNLNISNLAVVETLDLDFNCGMSVLTGETGAGKSIMLTALGLALGDRADCGFIRPECKRAEINLEFNVSDAPQAKSWLEENDLDQDDFCLIRRVINQDGRSKAYINNSPVTLQSLQTLSEKLVEIHGQHAHLTLLNTDEQRRLLDEYGKLQQLARETDHACSNWKKAFAELETLQQNARNREAREELLQFQIDELTQLDLDHFDYQALIDEHVRQANIEQILDSGQKQLDLLYESEHQSVYQTLGGCLSEIITLGQLAPEVNPLSELLNEAQIQVEETAQALRRFLESQEADSQRLEWLDSQIGVIQDLCRKHQVEPEQLPELFKQLNNELDNLTHVQEHLTELKMRSDQNLTDYHRLADLLSDKRHEAALQLQKDVSSVIKELGMPQGNFVVRITKHSSETPRNQGLDNIEFMVSTNPGLPAKQLNKVASGGELSRISLAIQVTTSSDKTTPTMIFDEVDSGIGGGTAEIVGQRLRALSQNRQVLCVTHLPQVAAQAHQHLFVAKHNHDGTTTSSVKTLARDDRIEEVARMLGGIKITENTLIHAREMLESAGKYPED